MLARGETRVIAVKVMRSGQILDFAFKVIMSITFSF